MGNGTGYRAMAVSKQARENRDYVRALLRKKYPEFAAMLEFALRELLSEEIVAAGAEQFGGGMCQCR